MSTRCLPSEGAEEECRGWGQGSGSTRAVNQLCVAKSDKVLALLTCVAFILSSSSLSFCRKI